MNQPSESVTTPASEVRSALDFVAQQCERDRAYFRHLFHWTAGAITVLLTLATAIGGFLIGRSLEEAKTLTTSELERVRSAVRQRVEAEFESDQIRRTIRQVVADRTTSELEPMIRNEVVQRVTEAMRRQQPLFERVAASEAARQLAKRQSPRHLEGWMREILIDVLNDSPQPKLYIDCAGEEQSEPCSHAREYAEVFRAAGWRDVLVRPLPKLAERPSVDFAVLTSGSLEIPEKAAQLIQKAFLSCFDYKIPVERNIDGPHDAPHLVVPLKSF